MVSFLVAEMIGSLADFGALEIAQGLFLLYIKIFSSIAQKYINKQTKIFTMSLFSLSKKDKCIFHRIIQVEKL